jgi:transposase
MNKKYMVRLSDEERGQLLEIISKGKASAYKIKHAHILLKADINNENGWTDEQIAEAFGVHINTVRGLRQRFVEEEFVTVLNRQKRLIPGRQRKLDGAGESKLMALSCSKSPPGRAHWALRLLADRLVELRVVDSISHETVRQTLKKTS